MSFLCNLGKHDWNGCKCIRCGKIQDKNHHWNGCKCAVCGKTQNKDHTWSGCLCTSCGTTRDKDHKWGEEKCLTCGKMLPAKKWAARLKEKKDFRGLAAVFNSTNYDKSFQKWDKRDIATRIFYDAGSEAVDAILEELSIEGVGETDLANILATIGDSRAVPLLKRLLDKGSFSAYSGTEETVREFVDRYPGLHEEIEKVACAVCGTVRLVTETEQCAGKRFCKGDCWRKRGRVIKAGSGIDCPNFHEGVCIIRDRDTGLCSLGPGKHFAIDCFAYKT